MFAIQHEDGRWWNNIKREWNDWGVYSVFQLINDLPLHIDNLRLEIFDRDTPDAGYFRRTGRKPVAHVRRV